MIKTFKHEKKLVPVFLIWLTCQVELAILFVFGILNKFFASSYLVFYDIFSDS